MDAQEILDIAMSGTSVTLFAKRWESALLVNVDNRTLEALLNNPTAMKSLESIEGFRSLNGDIATIISNSRGVRRALPRAAGGRGRGGRQQAGGRATARRGAAHGDCKIVGTLRGIA